MTHGTDPSVLKHRYRRRIYMDTFMVGMSRQDGLLILIYPELWYRRAGNRWYHLLLTCDTGKWIPYS